MSTDGITRRHALTGAATVGLGLPLLAACGGDGGDGGSGSSGAGGGSGSTAKAGEVLGPTSEVPVGGGKIYGDQKIVVTQPSKGDFKGFSAVCTHQGCTLATVSDGTIDCACHGSKFSIDDGANVEGPNGSAGGSVSDLPTVPVAVKGGDLTVTGG